MKKTGFKVSQLDNSFLNAIDIYFGRSCDLKLGAFSIKPYDEVIWSTIGTDSSLEETYDYVRLLPNSEILYAIHARIPSRFLIPDDCYLDKIKSLSYLENFYVTLENIKDLHTKRFNYNNKEDYFFTVNVPLNQINAAVYVTPDIQFLLSNKIYSGMFIKNFKSKLPSVFAEGEFNQSYLILLNYINSEEFIEQFEIYDDNEFFGEKEWLSTVGTILREFKFSDEQVQYTLSNLRR